MPAADAPAEDPSADPPTDPAAGRPARRTAEPPGFGPALTGRNAAATKEAGTR
ncbi:hypothetical protein [Streptomyces sp. C]|uniref:hypothetical protein n=1 Tax=Streptomyces sp. C TaxID=253839 RepID=UPI0001B57C62|nr:hypothetical protein [Streptomyces sp. C]